MILQYLQIFIFFLFIEVSNPIQLYMAYRNLDTLLVSKDYRCV